MDWKALPRNSQLLTYGIAYGVDAPPGPGEEDYFLLSDQFVSFVLEEEDFFSLMDLYPGPHDVEFVPTSEAGQVAARLDVFASNEPRPGREPYPDAIRTEISEVAAFIRRGEAIRLGTHILL